MFYADSLGFFELAGRPPDVDPNVKLNLMHLTAARPLTLTLDEVLREIDQTRKVLLENDRVRLILSRADLESLPEDKVGVVLGLQDTPKDVNVRRLYEAGIRFLAPAYKAPNLFGSGFQDPVGGLTNKGRWLLEKCAMEKVVVDLSHLGHRTAQEVFLFVATSQGKPSVAATHGGCYSVSHHLRNLPDDVLLNAKRFGGIVGIYILTFGLHQNSNDPEEFVRHFEYALELVGPDHVSIGSDGVYREIGEEEGRAHFEIMQKRLDPDETFEARYPTEAPIFTTPRKMEVIEELLRSCLPEAALRKVMGENFRNFLLRCLK